MDPLQRNMYMMQKKAQKNLDRNRSSGRKNDAGWWVFYGEEDGEDMIKSLSGSNRNLISFSLASVGSH